MLLSHLRVHFGLFVEMMWIFQLHCGVTKFFYETTILFDELAYKATYLVVGFKSEIRGEIRVDLGIIFGSLEGSVALLRCLGRLSLELDLDAGGNVAIDIVTSHYYK